MPLCNVFDPWNDSLLSSKSSLKAQDNIFFVKSTHDSRSAMYDATKAGTAIRQ